MPAAGRPVPGGNTRVVLAASFQNRLPGLAKAMAAAGDMTFRELYDIPVSLGKKVAAMRPDVVVCYCPQADESMVRAMIVMLAESACQIIILSPRPIVRDRRLDITRVSVLVMSFGAEGPRAVQQYHDVLSNVRLRAAAKRRKDGMGKGDSGSKGDAFIDQSFVLSDAVINKYIIAIGSSTGGTEALATLFKRLPPKMPGIVVVQHMPPVFTKMYADRLNNELPFHVVEGSHGVQVTPGSIHIAPGSNHMTIKKRGSVWFTEIGNDQKVGGHCPSVDVLFESMAYEAGPQAVGVILTGMGADGARGMLTMRRRGAFTVGQDEETSVVYGMPKKAFEYGGVTRQAGLTEIPRALLSYLARAK